VAATKAATILLAAPGPLGDQAAALLADRGHFVLRPPDTDHALRTVRMIRLDLAVVDRRFTGGAELEKVLAQQPAPLSVRVLVVDEHTPWSALHAALSIELRRLRGAE